MEVQINLLSVLVAAVVSMVIGFVYYSPAVVGKPWMKLMGTTPKSMKAAQKKMGMLYSLSFVTTLIAAYVLAHFVFLADEFYKIDPVMTGLTTAFFAWLGFIMPVQLTDFIFGGKKFNLFLINTGYQLLSFLAMGAVVGLMY